MKEVTINATLQDIRQAADFIESELTSLNCSEKIRHQIAVAVDELLANVINYAYEKDGGKCRVSFSYNDAAGDAVIRFTDRGIPFNPLMVEQPDVTLSASKRQIGGLGIFLVRKLMDDIAYRYEDGCNIITIRKKIRNN